MLSVQIDRIMGRILVTGRHREHSIFLRSGLPTSSESNYVLPSNNVTTLYFTGPYELHGSVCGLIGIGDTQDF